MSFANTLRTHSSPVPLPTSSSFNVDQWECAFKAMFDGSRRDRAIFEVGVLTWYQRRRIKATLVNLQQRLVHRTSAEMAQILCSRTNRLQLVAHAPWQEMFKGDGLISMEAIANTPCFVDAASNRHSPQAVMEATVDSVVVAFAY